MYDYYDDYSYYGDNISWTDIMDILSGVSDALDRIITILHLIMLAVGVVQCFWGYKLYRFTIAVNGFITGATFGCVSGIAMVIRSDGNSLSDIVTFTLIWMLICGVIGAVIAYHIELIGIFLIGFSGGYIVSLLTILLNTKAKNIPLSLFMAAIPAIITGVLVVKFWKPIVIIYTGIYGAMLIANGIGFGIIAVILCSIGGIYYQIKSNNGLTYSAERRLQQPVHNTENNKSAFNYQPIEKDSVVSKYKYEEENDIPDIMD